MKLDRLKLMAALALAGALAAPALAFIPVGVRLVVVSDDPHAQAVSRAYAEYLVEGRNFLIAEGVQGAPTIYPAELAKCVARGEQAAACARAAIPPHELNKEYPPVALLATHVSGSLYRWRCVGAAGEDYWPERQTVTIDLSEAMFGTPEQRAGWRDKAVACIFAAGTESGGRIRIDRDK